MAQARRETTVADALGRWGPIALVAALAFLLTTWCRYGDQIVEKPPNGAPIEVVQATPFPQDPPIEKFPFAILSEPPFAVGDRILLQDGFCSRSDVSLNGRLEFGIQSVDDPLMKHVIYDQGSIPIAPGQCIGRDARPITLNYSGDWKFFAIVTVQGFPKPITLVQSEGFHVE